MKKFILAGAFIAAVASQPSTAQSGRNYISIVGSSTVYPFAAVVAERFGKSTRFRTPKVESTGSGGGLKLFCAGIGVQHPDIANASRRIKKSELARCASNGVNGVVEVKVGYDGIVFGSSKKSVPVTLTRQQLFLALAKDVPDLDGAEKLVANPYATWQDIDPALPARRIEVIGPPPTSGTRDAFAELALESGCRTFDWIKAMKKTDRKAYKAICHSVREDGAYIEAGENDNLIVRKLDANPGGFGIFGFSFLDQNADRIQGNLIDGVEPTFEAIADGSYPVSRPLYFYVKKAHVGVIPGIREFLGEFTSARAWGDDGYLTEKGLIPLPGEERARFASNASELATDIEL